ncbi:MAG: response regulator transcription factor [Dehalococcoidales bacterium]|nr:response regulator transcription factor [Dehalococcoidales bacterium]
MNKIKLVVADDHPTFREGLCKLLSSEFDCVGEASNGKEAVKLAAKLKPDVMLIDVDMPVLNGYKAAEQISASNPDIAIIMLSAFDYDSYLFSSLRAGARGFLLKTTRLQKLIKAVRLVNDGQIVLDASVRDKLVYLMDRDATVHPKEKHGFFAPRELEVLRLTARGLTNKEIAQELNVSQRTIQAHMVNIFRKSESNSRTQAVYFALQKGWITIDGVNHSKDIDMLQSEEE